LNPQWTHVFSTLDFDNLLIMAVIVIALIAAFAIHFTRPRKPTVDVYLGGVGLDFEKRTYRNSLSGVSEATQRNWYLDGWFGEASVTPIATVIGIVVMAAGFFLAYFQMGGML
jgi:hypothetical protein